LLLICELKRLLFIDGKLLITNPDRLLLDNKKKR